MPMEILKSSAIELESFKPFTRDSNIPKCLLIGLIDGGSKTPYKTLKTAILGLDNFVSPVVAAAYNKIIPFRCSERPIYYRIEGGELYVKGTMGFYEFNGSGFTAEQIVIYKITLDQQMIMVYPEVDHSKFMTGLYRDIINNGRITIIPQ